MKKAPNRPQKTPIMMAAGRSSIEFSSSDETEPNLTAPESDKLSGLPFESAYRIETTKVEIEVEANTRHNILNVQKVLGFEISYANSAPPIGAPKATLTPHAAPHAVN